MKICLCMMVKNESKLIANAIRSVKPYISSYVIADTGSVDDTKEIATRLLDGIPGQYKSIPWKNYGESRTEALKLAFEYCGADTDWILILDADEKLENFSLLNDANTDIAYWMTIKYGGISYARPNLISTRQNWHYVGATHEYLTADPMPPAILLSGVQIVTDPSRTNKSGDRCLEDVKVLLGELEKDPNNSRYVFYLAQSYRDAGEPVNAIRWYDKRASMGGWFEEASYAALQSGYLKEQLGYSIAEIQASFLLAYELNSDRAESLGALARVYRMAGRNHLALMFADKSMRMPRPNQLLFIDESYYKWRCIDEYAIAAYWTGRYKESYNASELLLTSKDRLPESEVERVYGNREHARKKLAEIYGEKK